jgi:hypothetical protein
VLSTLDELVVAEDAGVGTEDEELEVGEGSTHRVVETRDRRGSLHVPRAFRVSARGSSSTCEDWSLMKPQFAQVSGNASHPFARLP